MNKPTPFSKIKQKQPSDLIIEQIHKLILSHELKPGQRLPSEPDLAKTFDTSRAQVRLAFKKLESYGIVETKPQSGTYISSIGIRILDGLLSNIAKMDYLFTPKSILEARMILETEAVSLAAERITPEELHDVFSAHQLYKEKAVKGITDVDNDLYFHLKIAEYSGNPVIRHITCLLIPQMARLIQELEGLAKKNQIRLDETIIEHENILEALQNHDKEAARKAMARHLSGIDYIIENLPKEGNNE